MDSITRQWLSPLLSNNKKTLWIVDEHFTEEKPQLLALPAHAYEAVLTGVIVKSGVQSIIMRRLDFVLMA